VEIGTEVGAYNTGTAIALQTDGKIVVSGVAHTNSTNNHFSLSRLQSSGAMDTTFGSGGSVVTFVAVPPESDISYGVVVQADGKVVVVGESTTARTNTFPYPGFVSLANVNFAAVRYTAAGVLDTSFGSSGMVTTDVNLLDDRCYAVALQADGSLVLAGGSFTYDPSDTIYGGYSSFAVVRYKTDGKLDSAFTSIK
jgi:uncharacterized delta-60 repeat protein